MLTGSVNDHNEAMVPLRLRSPTGAGWELPVHAVIDTGYTGVLSISAAIASVLNLPLYSRSWFALADGSRTQSEVYDVEVFWDGIWQALSAPAMDKRPLIGMELLAGHELRIAVKPGGAVAIDAIP